MKHFLLACMLISVPMIGFAEENENGDSGTTPPEANWPEIKFLSSADGTDKNILPGTEVTVKIVLPAEATNYTWLWEDASISTDTTYTFKAEGMDDISKSTDKQIKITIFHPTGTTKTEIILFHVWPKPSEAENSMMKITDVTNTQNTNLRYIREGNVISLKNPEMTGGFDSGWSYQWKIADRNIDNQHPSIPIGLNYQNGYLQTAIVCTVKNQCKDSVWFTKDYTLPITVYQRPEIPSSFTVKGNGTTGTYFIKDYQKNMGDLIIAYFSNNTPEDATIINSTDITQTNNGYWWFHSAVKMLQGRKMCLYTERNYGDTIKITSQLLELGSTTQRVWDGSTYPTLKSEPATDNTGSDDTPNGNNEELDNQRENDSQPSGSRVVMTFSINGGQTNRFTEGLNIVRMEDGTVRKVVVK